MKKKIFALVLFVAFLANFAIVNAMTLSELLKKEDVNQKFNGPILVFSGEKPEKFKKDNIVKSIFISDIIKCDEFKDIKSNKEFKNFMNILLKYIIFEFVFKYDHTMKDFNDTRIVALTQKGLIEAANERDRQKTQYIQTKKFAGLDMYVVLPIIHEDIKNKTTGAVASNLIFFISKFFLNDNNNIIAATIYPGKFSNTNSDIIYIDMMDNEGKIINFALINNIIMPISIAFPSEKKEIIKYLELTARYNGTISYRLKCENGACENDAGFAKIRYSEANPENFVVDSKLNTSINKTLLKLVKSKGIKINGNFDISTAFFKFVATRIDEIKKLHINKSKYPQFVLGIVAKLNAALNDGNVSLIQDLMLDFIKNKIK